MVTLWYLWRGFIHRGTTFNIVAPLITFCHMFGRRRTPSTCHLCWCSYWPPYSMDKFISCVVSGPSQWFFHFGKEIIITWTHFGWVQWMVQNLPLPAVQKSMTAVVWFLALSDGVLYHQESSLSPDCWMKVVLQECAVVDSIYHLPWRYNMVQYYPINVICRARKLRTYIMPKKRLLKRPKDILKKTQKLEKKNIKRQFKLNNFSFNCIFNEYNKIMFKKYKILVICNIHCKKKLMAEIFFFHK